MLANRRLLINVSLGLLLISSVACGDSSSAGDTAGGVASWKLTEEVRLGALDGGGPEQFGSSVALEVHPNGTLYIADQQSAEVRMFTREGDHIGSLGGKGSGPGEFLDVIGVAFDPAGRLWAADFGNRRFSIFNEEHQPVATERFNGFRSQPWRGRIDRHGNLHDLILMLSSAGPQLAYVNTASDDTLQLPRYEVQQREIEAGGRTRLINVPYAPRPHWALDLDGALWFGTSDRYALYRINYAGDTIARIERHTDRIPLSRSERQDALDRLRRNLGDDAVIDSEWLPRHRPSFEGIAADDRGRVWLQVPESEGHFRLDVFDETGDALAHVEVPETTGRPHDMLIRGDRVYLVTRSDWDVPEIVVLRIEP